MHGLHVELYPTVPAGYLILLSFFFTEVRGWCMPCYCAMLIILSYWGLLLARSARGRCGRTAPFDHMQRKKRKKEKPNMRYVFGMLVWTSRYETTPLAWGVIFRNNFQEMYSPRSPTSWILPVHSINKRGTEELSCSPQATVGRRRVFIPVRSPTKSSPTVCPKEVVVINFMISFEVGDFDLTDDTA